MKKAMLLVAIVLVLFGCSGSNPRFGTVVTHDPQIWSDAYLVRPLGGGQDDAPQLQAALDRLAVTGQALALSAGTFRLTSTGLTLPSGTVIYGNPGTIINQQLGGLGGFHQHGFSANVSIASTGTITASNTVGALTASVSINVGVGNLVQLLTADGLHGSIYTVTAQSGSGPYSITVDRAILYQWANGDAAFKLNSRPTGITIHGNGMTMSGTGLRFIEIPGCYRCLIERINLNGSLGSITDQAVSFDIGGVENTFDGMRLDGTSTMLDGIDLESNERSQIINSFASNVRYGFGIYDGTDIELRGNSATGCHGGVGIVGDITTVGGSGIRVIGGSYFGNTMVISTIPGAGIYVGRGSNSLTATVGTIIDGVDLKNNGYGVYVDGSTVPVNTKIANVTATGNTNGIFITSGALGTMVENVDVSTNSNAGISAQAEFYAKNVVGDQVAISLNAGAYDAVVDGFRFQSSLAATGVISVTAGNILSLSNGFINLTNGAGYGVFCTGAGAVVKGSNFRVAGGTYGVAVAGGGACTFRQGPGYESTATTPVITGGLGSSYWSRGSGTGVASFTCPGSGVAQDVTWPNIKNTDVVQFGIHTVGGTPGPIRYTITAGSKVSATCTTADTSTIDMIVP